jgi:putative phage-type endonuclease
MNDDRNTYIGGPGAAAVLGINPYLSGVGLWMQLTGRAPPVEVTPQMRSGMRLERAVLDYAQEELGTQVLPGPFVRDAKLPLGGHLDGVTDTGEVVEAKTARSRNGWGEPGSADVPAVYAAQVLHYLGLTGAKVGHLAVLFSGLEFAMYRIERDDKLIEQMKNLCWRWWRDYVETDNPPPPTTGNDASVLFPRDAGRVVVADDATASAVAKLREVRRLLSDLETERDDCEARIKLAMRDAATLTVAGEVAVTWKTAKPSLRFDSGAFKLVEPDLYTKFCRPIESRRFLVKEMK